MGNTKMAPVKINGPKLNNFVATVFEISNTATNAVEMMLKYRMCGSVSTTIYDLL
jgi:hypothetical protein